VSDFTPELDNTSEPVEAEEDDDFAALVAEFESRYETVEEDEEIAPAQEEEVPSETHSAEEEPQTSPESGQQEDSRIELMGREWEREQVEGLVEFYDWMAANPQAALDIDRYARGQARIAPLEDPAAPQPQVQQVQPPEPVDDSIYDDIDPAIAAKLRKIDELSASTQEIQERQQQAEQAQVQQVSQERMSQAQQAVRVGADNFATRMGLDPDTIQALQDEAAELEILPGLARQKGDFVAAVEESLEIAYWRNPKYRDQAIEARVNEQAQERKRTSKANALTGSSGSAPREAPQFDLATEDGRRKAMVADLKASLNDGNLS